jgi:hypothetical protein
MPVANAEVAHNAVANGLCVDRLLDSSDPKSSATTFQSHEALGTWQESTYTTCCPQGCMDQAVQVHMCMQHLLDVWQDVLLEVWQQEALIHHGELLATPCNPLTLCRTCSNRRDPVLLHTYHSHILVLGSRIASCNQQAQCIQQTAQKENHCRRNS